MRIDPKIKMVKEIKFDTNMLQFNDEMNISTKICTEVVEKIDDAFINTLYEMYKDSDVSTLYVFDKSEFKKFLLTMLPIYREMIDNNQI